MAYTPTVTKQSVVQMDSHLYHVSIEMVVSDGVENVFTCTATEKYSTGDSLSNLKNRLVDNIKAQWDKYEEEHNLFTSAAFDTMIDNIQTAAEGYIS